MMRSSLILPLAFLVTACSSSDDGDGVDPGDPVSQATAEADCADLCEHMMHCEWDDDQTMCEEDCASGAAYVRSDFFGAYGDCMMALECTDDMDSCYEEEMAELTVLACHEAFETACAAKLTECGYTEDMVDPVCDPVESGLVILSTATTEALTACFEEECDAIFTCMEEAMGDDMDM